MVFSFKVGVVERFYESLTDKALCDRVLESMLFEFVCELRSVSLIEIVNCSDKNC